MKSLLVLLIAAPSFAFAECPTSYPYRADNKTVLEKEIQKFEQAGTSVENCSDVVTDIINADTQSHGGAPGISRTTITSCDGENVQYNRKMKIFFKIVRFQAIGPAKSDGFIIRTENCPTDAGNSVIVTISSLTK